MNADIVFVISKTVSVNLSMRLYCNVQSSMEYLAAIFLRILFPVKPIYIGQHISLNLHQITQVFIYYVHVVLLNNLIEFHCTCLRAIHVD